MQALLVVEDNPDIRQFLTVILPTFGVCVHLAGSCTEGLRVLREHPDIRAAMLDVDLPDEDGPATLKALRQLVPDLRAVYVTGDPDTLPAGHGAEAVLAKPFGIGDLRKLVHRLVKS
jgi:CheY-like chemotaxis protein